MVMQSTVQHGYERLDKLIASKTIRLCQKRQFVMSEIDDMPTEYNSKYCELIRAID